MYWHLYSSLDPSVIQSLFLCLFKFYRKRRTNKHIFPFKDDRIDNCLIVRQSLLSFCKHESNGNTNYYRFCSWEQLRDRAKNYFVLRIVSREQPTRSSVSPTSEIYLKRQRCIYDFSSVHLTLSYTRSDVFAIGS